MQAQRAYFISYSPQHSMLQLLMKAAKKGKKRILSNRLLLSEHHKITHRGFNVKKNMNGSVFS